MTSERIVHLENFYLCVLCPESFGVLFENIRINPLNPFNQRSNPLYPNPHFLSWFLICIFAISTTGADWF